MYTVDAIYSGMAMYCLFEILQKPKKSSSPLNMLSHHRDGSIQVYLCTCEHVHTHIYLHI